MKYISLFSGIGGFEQGIHKVYPKADCIAYSEIDKYAIQIYKTHFPKHVNLGDITKITNSKIKGLVKKHGCDLIVSGFPCTNLSSMANIQGDNRGLKGPKSGLFYDMIRVIKCVYSVNPKVKFMIENNYSMRKEERNVITNTLKKSFNGIQNHVINNASFGVQTRKRIIWTNFQFKPPSETHECVQTWNDVLEPLDKVKEYKLSDKMITCLNKLLIRKNSKGDTKVVVPSSSEKYRFKHLKTTTEKSRWDIHGRSDNMTTALYSPYPVGKSRPITSGAGGGNNILIDRRVSEKGDAFIVRNLLPVEIERLFGFEDDYTNINGISRTKRIVALGNSIPTFIVTYVLSQM